MDKGEPISREQLLAEASEFFVFNTSYRVEVNEPHADPEFVSAAAAIRHSLQNIVFSALGSFKGNGNVNGYDPLKAVRKAKGEVINIKNPASRHSGFRFIILRFLESLEEHVKEHILQNDLLHPQVSYALTSSEYKQKGSAKRLMRDYNFQEALTLLIDLYHSSSNAQRNPGVLGSICFCYYRLREYQKCLFYAEHLLAIQPDDLIALFNASWAASHLNHYEKALEYSERLICLHSARGDPDSHKTAPDYGVAAVSAFKLGQYEKSFSYGQKALQFDPSRHYLFFVCAKSAFYLRRFGLAYKYNTRCVELLTTRDPFHFALQIFLCYVFRQYEKVLEYASYIRNSTPQFFQSFTFCAQAALRLHRLKEAEKYARAVLHFDPKDPSALSCMAQIARARGDSEGASSYDTLSSLYRELKNETFLESFEKVLNPAAFEAEYDPDFPNIIELPANRVNDLVQR